MEIRIEGSVRNRKYVGAILPSMLDQLKLNNCRKGLLIRIYDECGDNSGCTVPIPGLDSFVVVIKPKRDLNQIGLTLAHEMVHVKQMAKGCLKSTNKGYVWAGKKYSKKIKYLDMPWEVEAFSKQELILRRAYEI